MPQLKQNLGALALILSLPLLSSALTLPLMPFSINELLLPGQTRYCHLYEARFLSLLEYSLAECDGQGEFAVSEKTSRWERVNCARNEDPCEC